MRVASTGGGLETGPSRRGAERLFESGAFASSARGMAGSLGGYFGEGSGGTWKGVTTGLSVPWKGDTTAFSERSAVLDRGWRAHSVDYAVSMSPGIWEVALLSLYWME